MASERALGGFARIQQGRYLPPHAMAQSRSAETPIPVWGANGIIGFAESPSYEQAVPLVTCRGNGCGLVQWTGGAAYISNNAMAIVPNDTSPSDTHFLYYALLGTDFADVTTGTAQPQITVGHLSRKLVFWTESRDERAAIANILGTLDDKIALNRQMNETLEAMARALFKSWFVDFDPVRAKAEGRDPGLPQPLDDLFPDSFEDSELGEIPRGWEVGTLADLASLNPESWSKETRPPEIEYIDLSNTKWGRIEAVTPYATSDAPSRAQRVLRPGDTVVGTVRPGNGSYALISGDDLTGSTGFAVLRPRAEKYVGFVYLAATAADNIDALQHLADGGAYPAVRPEVVAATSVVRPDDKVVGRFSLAVRPLLAKLADNERESRTLADLRDALLPKLITGEVRFKDAEDLIQERTV